MPARVRDSAQGVELTGASATVVVTKPTGTIDDDGMVLHWFTITVGTAATHTTPSGWTLQGTGTGTASGGALGTRLSVFTKVAASEGANYTLTASGASYQAASIVTAKNVDTAALFEAIGAHASSTGWTTVQLPAVTTTKQLTLLVGACNNAGGASFTGQDLTELLDANGTYAGAIAQSYIGASSVKEVIGSGSGAGLGRIAAINSLANTIDLVTPNATSGDRITATSDIAADDETQWRATSGGGNPPSDFVYLSNGSFYWVPGATLEDVDFRARDDGDSTLGAWATQQMVATAANNVLAWVRA